jgi:hypothetical protein
VFAANCSIPYGMKGNLWGQCEGGRDSAQDAARKREYQRAQDEAGRLYKHTGGAARRPNESRESWLARTAGATRARREYVAKKMTGAGYENPYARNDARGGGRVSRGSSRAAGVIGARRSAAPAVQAAPPRAPVVRAGWAAKAATLGAIEVDPTAKAPWYADLAQGVLAVIKGDRIARENQRRIAAGLPPLTQNEAKALVGATPVDVVLPPEVKTLIYVGAGAIALLTLAALSKGRR